MENKHSPLRHVWVVGPSILDLTERVMNMHCLEGYMRSTEADYNGRKVACFVRWYARDSKHPRNEWNDNYQGAIVLIPRERGRLSEAEARYIAPRIQDDVRHVCLYAPDKQIKPTRVTLAVEECTIQRIAQLCCIENSGVTGIRTVTKNEERDKHLEMGALVIGHNIRRTETESANEWFDGMYGVVAVVAGYEEAEGYTFYFAPADKILAYVGAG